MVMRTRSASGASSRVITEHEPEPAEAAAGPAAAAAAVTDGAALRQRKPADAAETASPLLALLSATVDDDDAAARLAGSGSGGRQPWGTLRPGGRARALLGHVNEATKWVVSALVGAVLVAAHNEWAAWAVVGAVLSSFLCKALKRVINEQRPAEARKKDPGMPSSHSNSLNFLSVTAALSLRHHAGGDPVAAALASATVAAGLFLTWLRVALGYHTWPQVIVGGLLGASTAAAWFSLGAGPALAALRAWPPGLPLLYGATLLGVAAFAARNVLAWARERREAAEAAAAAAAVPSAG